jgi:hypothetical protein
LGCGSLGYHGVGFFHCLWCLLITKETLGSFIGVLGLNCFHNF